MKVRDLVVGVIIGLLLGAGACYGVFESQVSTLQSQVASRDTQITALQTQLSNLNVQIASLQRWLSANVTRVTQLEAQISTLNTQTQNLTNQISSLQTKVANLKAQIATLQPRIGVRVEDGVGEFYDQKTGEKFVPRGYNYIRLANQSACGKPNLIYHSTFDPGLYDSARVEQAFTKMKQDSYNVVRVFINQLCVVDQAGRLSTDYVHNFVDFLQHAKTNNVFVMVVIDGPPEQYWNYVEDIPLQSNIDGPNLTYLTQRGIEVEKRFWQDFIEELIRQKAPLDYIFAYELRNEAFFSSDQKPLTLTSGFVVTGNGRSYDMSKTEDKQKMMDENLVFWIDSVRQAILQLDPTALVTIGFFQPQGPNPTRIGDTRVIRTYSAIWESSADFIDLHLYPGLELNMVQYVENFEISGSARKPIIMGEFGSFKSSHWSASLAAQVLQDWQVESCRYGFDGWLLWTWDTDEQPELWNGLAEGGVINQALSPRNRPDPQLAGIFSGQNMALGKSTTVSHSLPDNPAAMAVDGLLGNWWGTGDFPPQWIEIDLQAPSSIGKIRLAVSQSPAGETTHRVWGKGVSTGEVYQLLYEFRGFTTDGQVLEYTPLIPWTGIQFIKVETVASPSWVSWREIEILRA